MKIRYIVILIIALLFPVSTQGQGFCDACKEVLKLGQRTIAISASSNENDATKSWFCSSSFVQHVTSSSFRGGITVPIEGVPVNFNVGSDNAESFQRREAFCSNSSRNFNREDTYNIFQQLADENVVREWGRCVERSCSDINPSNGLSLALTRTGNQISARLRWSPRFTGEQPPVITSVSRTNLTCSSDLIQAQKVVNVEGLEEHCTTDSRQNSTLLINTTTAGPISKTVLGDLTGTRAGRAIVTTTVNNMVRRPFRRWTRDIRTGDHHCGGGPFSCRGEDRRTRYELDITVGADEFLVNPRLDCIDGPCGFSKVWQTIVTNDGHRAFTAFDTWSRPTTWRLSADSERLENSPIRTSVVHSLIYGDQVTLRVPRNRAGGEVQVAFESGSTFIIPIGDTITGRFEIVNRSSSGDNDLFTYGVITPRN